MNIFKRLVATICRIPLDGVNQGLCPDCGAKLPTDRLHREITDDYLPRLKCLSDLSGLEIRMWYDEGQRERVYVFRNESGEIIRMCGYKKAEMFAKGVEYGREHSKRRKP